jgi:WD40 repeat protein
MWDRQTGEQHPTLEGHQDWVHGVCPVTVVGRELLASAGDDCTMRIWAPRLDEGMDSWPPGGG